MIVIQQAAVRFGVHLARPQNFGVIEIGKVPHPVAEAERACRARAVAHDDEMIAAGVDLINTDDLKGLRKFLQELHDTGAGTNPPPGGSAP